MWHDFYESVFYCPFLKNVSDRVQRSSMGNSLSQVADLCCKMILLVALSLWNFRTFLWKFEKLFFVLLSGSVLLWMEPFRTHCSSACGVAFSLWPLWFLNPGVWQRPIALLPVGEHLAWYVNCFSLTCHRTLLNSANRLPEYLLKNWINLAFQRCFWAACPCPPHLRCLSGYWYLC